MDFADPQSPNFPVRYYRVVLPAPTGPFVQPLVLSQVVRLPSGQFRFAVLSPTGQVLRVQATTNLVNWSTLSTLTNTNGVTIFTDTAAPSFPRRLYRAISP